MTHEQLLKAMREYNQSVAPGSECVAWQDYVEDCNLQYGDAPWRLTGEIDDAGFAEYWHDVATCQVYHRRGW